MRQPGLGNVAVNKGVPIYVRKEDHEIQAQRETGQRHYEKETFVALQQNKKFTHARQAAMKGM